MTDKQKFARLNNFFYGKKTTVKNPQMAFKQAIQAERLSDKAKAENFAGKYMYMGTDGNGKDLFKNIFTRQYDV